MATAQLLATPPASDYCPTNWAQLVADLQNYLRVVLSGSLGINTGNAVPAVADQGNPWFRYNADGTPDAWYVYSTGDWISTHPMAPGSTMMYYSETPVASTFFETLDGGEAGAPVAPWKNGQMWEVVTQLAAKSPMGPGTLAAGDVLTAGMNFGEDRHVLLQTELAKHQHTTSRDFTSGSGQTAVRLYSGHNFGGGDNVNVMADGGSDVAHNTVHPVFCIWFIRRTARLFKRA